MRKHNSSEFQEFKGITDDKHGINVNLWDLDGSSFFLDKDIKELDSTATFNNTVLNCNNYNNINIISSKDKNNDLLFPITKFPKNKNKSVNSSFVKYNNFPSERKKMANNIKAKNNINNKNINKMKNNSFCQNDKFNDSLSKDLNKKKDKKSVIYNSKIKKAKQRLNHSVDYARNEQPKNKFLFGNNINYNFNNKNNNKKQNLNKSLSIEALSNKNNSKISHNNI